jgi:cysteine desulfurase/selenocysteine lyase
MSTSDTKPPVSGDVKLGVPVNSWDGLSVPAGLPDPAVLARMATEFFTAPSGFSQPSGAVSDLGALSSLTLPSAGIPIEAELSALPESLGSFSSLSSASAANLRPPSYSPVVPGDWSAAGLGGAPGFSFLQEARPLFSDTAPFAFSYAPYSDSSKDSPESIFGAVTPAVPYSAAPYTVKDPGAPAVAGAATRPEAASRPGEFEFLDQARRLYPLDVIPAVEPGAAQAASLPDLGISSRSFEVNEIRRDFPILQERVNGRQLVWLDNAATTQKPRAVIDRLNYFYAHENSNIHRAAHELAARATDAYEAAREKTRRFLNAPSVREIIFVRGATEGINLVAQSWGRLNVHKDDEIVITWLEHHANIVPWQMLCADKGARLRVAPVDDTGQVLLDEYAKLLGPKTRLVALPQVSNALGTLTPAQEMIQMAHRHGAKVLLDGAQAVSHLPVDVQVLDCDFYVFSGHKVFARPASASCMASRMCSRIPRRGRAAEI